MKISYCTSVWNEHIELNRLLTLLVDNIDLEDEIVIQGDQGKVTDSVISVIRKFNKDNRIKYHEYPLRKDFAKFKNQMFSQCTGDWIFNLDADELIDSTVLTSIKELIANNSHIDCYAFPRINTVNGMADENVVEWGWRISNINGMDVVNWPDYQKRLFKNNGLIYFDKNVKVHEQLCGFNNVAFLPSVTSDWAIIHHKDIERQISQNKFYSTI